MKEKFKEWLTGGLLTPKNIEKKLEGNLRDLAFFKWFAIVTCSSFVCFVAGVATDGTGMLSSTPVRIIYAVLLVAVATSLIMLLISLIRHKNFSGQAKAIKEAIDKEIEKAVIGMITGMKRGAEGRSAKGTVATKEKDVPITEEEAQLHEEKLENLYKLFGENTDDKDK